MPVIFAACDDERKADRHEEVREGVTSVATATLPAPARVNELWYPPVRPFTYVKPLGVWAGNIPTAKLASGKKYTYRVDLADGTSFTVTFGVR